MNPLAISKDDEISQSIDILRRHNKWRRGEDWPMADPYELGKAIECVCDAAEKNLPLVSMIEKLRVQLQVALEEVVNLTFARDDKRNK